VLGAIFVVHGYLKLFSRSYGPAQFRKYLAGEKVPFPTQTGLAIGVLEFAAGFCRDPRSLSLCGNMARKGKVPPKVLRYQFLASIRR